MRVVELFFGWPAGAVWANLLASVIWAAPTIAFGARHFARKHRHLLGRVEDLHRRLDEREL